MKRLYDVAAGELCGNDLGHRILITRDGISTEATLTQFTPYMQMDGRRTTEPQILTLKIVTTSSLTHVELKNLPLDYRVQIERGDSSEAQDEATQGSGS